MQDRIVEGEQGWVLQGVLSRASFRRAAASGQKFFSALSLHIRNIYAKKNAKKIIQTFRAIMISQDVDLVAGDFNGTAWRCRSRDNLSIIDEVFADTALLTLPGPTIVGDLDPSRTIGLTRVVFSSPLALCASGRSISMVLFPSLGKLLAYDPVIEAATMRHGFINILSIGTTNGTIKRTATGTSVLRNDQRVLDMELTHVTSAKF